MAKKKNFDAVEMVRDIRDAHYEQIKDMTRKERLAFYRNRGKEAQEKLKRLAEEQKAGNPE